MTIGAAEAQTPALDQLDTATAQASALLTKIHQQLFVYDRVLQMKVARGVLTSEQASNQLGKRAEDLAKGTVTDAAQEDEERQEAGLFFDAIDQAAEASPHWPKLQTSAFYRALVGVIIARVRADHARQLTAHQNTAQALDDAYRALALTRGQDNLADTPFSNPDSRIFVAMELPNPPKMPALTIPPSALEPGVVRAGKDITVLELASDDPLQCEAACQQNPGCRAFSFAYATSQGAKAKCALKHEVAPPRPDACCVSEVIPGRGPAQSAGVSPPSVTPPKPAAMALEAGVDRPGLDYRDFTLPAADPNLCETACDKEAACRAFTYVKPGAQGQPAHCWIKASIPKPHQNTCCVSGTKGASEPGAVKALFEKHNLIGTFAWNCDQPAGVDNQYFVNKLQDPDHVMREHSFGPGKATIKTVIDGIAELRPDEITFSGTTGGQPVQGVWRVEPKRVQQLDTIYNGRSLISDGKDVGTGRPVPWLYRCGS